MSESRRDPTSPLAAPRKINGTCEEVWSPTEANDFTWAGGGASRNNHPKNTKPSQIGKLVGLVVKKKRMEHWREWRGGRGWYRYDKGHAR